MRLLSVKGRQEPCFEGKEHFYDTTVQTSKHEEI